MNPNTAMNPEDVIRLVQETVNDTIGKIVDDKLDEFNNKQLGFRSWQPQGSVTDQFSPITGASTQIGFFGKSKITQPTVTGSRGGNAALQSLLVALSNLGIVINSSS